MASSLEMGMVGTMALVPQVVDAVTVPVIASGGIMDGRGIAAALALQQQLCEVAATVLGCPPGAVTLDNGVCVVHSAPTQRLTFAEVAAAAAAGQRSLRAQKLYRVSQSPHMSPCTAQVVEVEVDSDTGQVTLLDVVTTHDVGTIINP